MLLVQRFHTTGGGNWLQISKKTYVSRVIIVGTVMDNVALGQVFVRELWYSPYNYVSTNTPYSFMYNLAYGQ